MDFENKILLGDSALVLKEVPEKAVQCVVSSPEYYGNVRWSHSSLEDFLALQKSVFLECFRVLKDDGTMFININDHFIQSEDQYLNVPAHLDFLLRGIGFICPQPTIIWLKDTAMVPKNRLQDIWEYIFIYSKISNPKFDKEKLRTVAKYNKDRRLDTTNTATKAMPNVWEINKVFADGVNHKKVHSCPYPTKLVESALTLATGPGDLVLDPYAGSATTCYVAKEMGRKYLGIEIDKTYYEDALRNVENSMSVYKYEPGFSRAQKTLFDLE